MQSIISLLVRKSAPKVLDTIGDYGGLELMAMNNNLNN